VSRDGVEHTEQVGEELVIRVARAASELLARHSGAERIRAVVRLERGQHKLAQPRLTLGMHEPFAVHGDDFPRVLQPHEERAERVGTERHTAR
jgi:hypothetical protein